MNNPNEFRVAAPAYIRNEDDEIDLRQLIGVLLDNRWLIAATTLAAVLLAGLYLWQASPIYRTDVLIQVEQKQSGIPGLEGMSEMFSGAGTGTGSRADTEIQIFKSRSVIGEVVDKLKLDVEAKPHYFPVIGARLAAGHRPDQAELAQGATNPPPLADPFMGLDSYAWGGEAIDVFQLTVPEHLKGETLVLTYEGDQAYNLAHEGRRLLTGMVGEPATGSGIRLTVKELRARPGTEFLLVQKNRVRLIKELQNQIRISEQGRMSGILQASLESAQPAKAKAILDAVSQQYVLQNVKRMSAEAQKSLEFLREQMPEIKQELEVAEAALNRYRAEANSVDISIETEGLLTKLVEIDNKISEINLKRSEVERKYTPEHPAYIALMDQLAKLKQDKKEIESDIGRLPDTQQKLLRLMRDVEVKTELYTQLLGRAQELDIARAGTVGNVRLIDEAVVDTSAPVKPQKGLTLMLSLMLGGMFGVGAAFVRAMMHRGVESPDQIEALGLPVYAAIPFSEEQAKRTRALQKHDGGKEAVLLAEQDPADLSIEALRSLRTSLHFAFMGAKNQCIALTGASPGVGKSFISANLAVLLAQSGERVLLIDGDMRKGTLHHYAGLDAENGLSDLLSGQVTLDKTLKTVDGFQMITRGQIPPNPSELLMSAAFERLLNQLNEQYDVVLIDTPPVLAVTDAAVICGQVSTTLIVVRFGVNPVDEIRLSLSRLSQANVTVKGAVLNGVVKKAGGYYYQNAYYQYEYK